MRASKCQRLVFVTRPLEYTICPYCNLCRFFFFSFYIFAGAAQGCDWGGRDRDHCSSCHNNWHYSVFPTQYLHCQQTILLLHIPRKYKVYAVHGQGDWPHQKLAVLTEPCDFWCDCTLLFRLLRGHCHACFNVKFDLKFVCWSVF